MPLDFEIIDMATAYSKHALTQHQSTACPNIMILKDFLYPPLLKKLYNFVNTEDLKWRTVLFQEYQNRRAISWLPDSVIEETHCVLDNLTEQVCAITNKNLKFLGLDIWRDIYPYTINKHCDRELIQAALQIYLNHTDIDLSTKFYWEDKVISPPYITNNGYFMNNCSKIEHEMLNQVPKNFVRYSLYAIWKV